MGSAFAEDTAVHRVDTGRYRASLSSAWNLLPLPQGGVITAIAARAMATELDDGSQRLRSLHTTFVSQVTDGPLAVEVETLRRGRSMSHLRADVHNEGARSGHVTTAAYGSSRRGFSFDDLDPPAAPPPDQCASWRTPPPPGVEGFTPMPFWSEQVEGRTVHGHAPWEDFEPGRAETVMWYGFDETPWLDDGTVDPLAMVVLVDTMPGSIREKLGRLAPARWFSPSIDLTVHLFGPCRSPWVLARSRTRHADDGYASAEMAVWDCGTSGTETPRLVAYGTQGFVSTFPD